jgi:hypothetical protein
MPKKSGRRHRRPANPVPSQRLRLPDGTSVEVPNPDHPAWAALDRLRRGAPHPEDSKTVAAWLPTVDPRYLQYMRALAQVPSDTADVVGGKNLGKGPDAAQTVFTRLVELLDSGELGMCVHVRPHAPNPAIWTAWSPSKLRCLPCAETAGTGIKGTKEDRRCDACGYIGARVYQISKLTPPVKYRQLILPILVIFGLCPRCAGPEVIQAQRAAKASST